MELGQLIEDLENCIADIAKKKSRPKIARIAKLGFLEIVMNCNFLRNLFNIK